MTRYNKQTNKKPSELPTDAVVVMASRASIKPLHLSTKLNGGKCGTAAGDAIGGVCRAQRWRCALHVSSNGRQCVSLVSFASRTPPPLQTRHGLHLCCCRRACVRPSPGRLCGKFHFAPLYVRCCTMCYDLPGVGVL